MKKFILAFKEAYQKINADKIQARNHIKEMEKLQTHFYCDHQIALKIEEYLGAIWQSLPIKQRKDYVQKTLDLFHYGFDVKYHEDGTRTYYGGYDYGLTKIYNHLEKTLFSAIEEAKRR